MVRINSHGGEELRLWFTRRLAIGLLPHLRRTAHEQMRHHAGTATPGAPLEHQRQQLLKSFQKEADAYRGDYETPFKAESTSLPLGTEPLLITEVKVALLPQGKVDLQLLEKSRDQVRNIQLGMNPQLMQGLMHLLGEGLKKAKWLDAALQDETPMADSASMALLSEVDDTGERPKYLN